MQNRSIHDVVRSAISIPIEAKTDATENGAGVDGYDADAKMFEILIGTWTDGDHTFSFEDSPDGTTWTAVAAADLDEKNSGDLTGATVVVDDATKDDTIVQIGYIGGKQHVRAKLVTASSTTGAVLGAAVVEARLRSRGKTPMDPSWQ